MSSKSARRKSEYKKRQEKRQRDIDRQNVIRNDKGIEELAKLMGVNLM